MKYKNINTRVNTGTINATVKFTNFIIGIIKLASTQVRIRNPLFPWY